jgi:putative addiction module killer protein
MRDHQARGRILARIRRLSLGNSGDVEPVGEGVSELRIDYGPGYRIYFKRRGNTVIVLLAAGDKRTQKRDIEKVKELARNL